LEGSPRHYVPQPNPNHHKELLELFAHNLQPGQYRTFSNGKVMATVFKDTKIVFTVSSEFDSDHVTRVFLRGLDTSSNKPRLSERAVDILKNLPHDDLKRLAKDLGQPESKLQTLICKYQGK